MIELERMEKEFEERQKEDERKQKEAYQLMMQLFTEGRITAEELKILFAL